VHTGVSWATRERDHLECLGLDWRIILKCIFKKQKGGLDWICVARDKERWCALMYAVMNLRFP